MCDLAHRAPFYVWVQGGSLPPTLRVRSIMPAGSGVVILSRLLVARLICALLAAIAGRCTLCCDCASCGVSCPSILVSSGTSSSPAHFRICFHPQAVARPCSSGVVCLWPFVLCSLLVSGQLGMWYAVCSTAITVTLGHIARSRRLAVACLDSIVCWRILCHSLFIAPHHQC